IGELSIDLSNSSVELDFGYGETGTEIALTGLVAEINEVLKTVHLHVDSEDKGRQADGKIMACYADDAVYSTVTEHFCKYVESVEISWHDAALAAQNAELQGQSGYHATVPNDAMNDLTANRIEGATTVWLGGKAIDPPAQ